MPMFKKDSRGTKPLVTQSVSLAFRDGKLVRTLITAKNLWMHGLDKFVEESCTLQVQSPEHSHTVILFVLNSSSTVVGICTGYHSLTHSALAFGWNKYLLELVMAQYLSLNSSSLCCTCCLLRLRSQLLCCLQSTQSELCLVQPGSVCLFAGSMEPPAVAAGLVGFIHLACA